MSEEKHIIEPQRMGLWVAVAFALALLALALSMVNMKRSSESMLITQTEILVLKQQMQDLHKDAMPPTAAAGQSQTPK
ncbi:MAG: hypothetical protein H6R07_1372 [Proteobacteria bacterium]|nr:hypothetical protein [Pseudomonadota bacterium]